MGSQDKAGLKQRVRDLASSSPLKKLPVDSLVYALERRRMMGDREGAIGIGRQLTAAVPRSGKAHRYLVKALIGEGGAGATAADFAKARVHADLMIGLFEDPRVASEYADVYIAQHVAGITDPDPARAMGAFAIVRPDPRFAAFRRFLVHLVSAGDESVADVARDVARSVDTPMYWFAAGEFALRVGRTDIADEIDAELADRHPDWRDEHGSLRGLRQNRSRDPLAAIAALTDVPPTRSPAFSRQMLDALFAAGRYVEVLSYLDGTYHSLMPNDELDARFRALFVLGRLQEAFDLINGSTVDLADVRLLRHRIDAAKALGVDDTGVPAVIAALRAADARAKSEVDDVVHMAFQANELDVIDEVEADSATSWRLGPIGRYCLALNHYCQRRYPQAIAALDTLPGTLRHWQGEKLRARILFEQGDDAGARALRATMPAWDGTLDEVEYHALLHQGALDEAFALYCSDNDRRRGEVTFGDRAEGAPLDTVECRAVITQDGPGDELQYAGLIPLLSERSERLLITCDPRLESLLTRSFPGVEFVAVERMRSQAHAGFLGPDRPARADGPLFDLLTAEAAKLLGDADRVVMGRSLPALSTRRSEVPGAYLVPDPQITSPLTSSGERPQVGVVWRSEFGSAMRDIHYLSVDQLGPIVAHDIDVVVLQHDATPDELAHLETLAPGRVVTVDGVDLRDDFETSAAVVVGLDAVVGVGTTMVELAGGLGVPSVLIHPTRFGTWRATGEDGTDYWHRHTTVVGSDRADDKASAATAAGVALQRLLAKQSG